MLIVMKPDATDEQVSSVLRVVEELGYRPHPMPGAQRTAVGVTGNTGPVDPGPFENLPGVAEAIRVTKPYKLVSTDLKPERTVVRVGDVAIGGGELAIIAGPCAVETREQTMETAELVARAGVKLFRAGAFKPRTSPYSFQGLGLEGLKILAEVRDRFGLKIVTETIDPQNLELVAEYADVLQIGARNMQNFSLLRAAGQARKPVLLKRGMSATLDELLLAAEYVMSEGNYQVVLCERGVRTFADHTRNTLDLSIVPAVQRLSHLPILVDPSHGTGKRHKVIPLARAGVAVGADGVIVEVHPHPERALSDGPQALLPDMFLEMVDELGRIHAIVGRHETAMA
jgi:3-deoxy-7-phosphoheptulonate synthase